MSEADVARKISRRGGFATLDEVFKAEGARAWSELRGVTHSAPHLCGEDVANWIEAHAAESPSTAFAALLDLAAQDTPDRAKYVARCRALMEKHPGPALSAAGYNFHEYCRLLDARWIADARKYFDADPEGGFGIATAAASYAPKIFSDEDVDWFEARANADPEACCRMLFQLASSDSARRERMAARALARFDAHPAAAIKAAANVAREKSIMRPELVAAVLRAFAANLEDAWKFFAAAAHEHHALLGDDVLDALTAAADTGPADYFGILHRVADLDAKRAPDALARFARLLPAHPKEGINEAHYVAINDAHLLTPALMDAVADHFGKEAYYAFDVMHAALKKRPELLHDRHIRAAAENIALATNWAFGFFRTLLEDRPDTAPLCSLALFECLAQEPPNRAHVRAEELQAIVTIAQASHVKTQMEQNLREPPSVGSRRARALMAILFRQKLRAKQHVLFEALRLVATASARRNLNRTPLWEFFLFLLDESPDKTITTTAAERFLEGAFQLTHLLDRGTDHDEFREKFEVFEPEPTPWPEAAAFLAEDAALDRLHRIVRELARRCGASVELRSLDEYAARAARAEEELAAISRQLASAEDERRARLEKRRAHLEQRLALWRDPAPGPEGRAELERERRGLKKSASDDLRAELARISVEAVEVGRRGLYASRIEAALGRKVDVTKVDPTILPAFLFFPALNNFPNNRKWLARLVEDRLLGKRHDWLRTDPAAQKWSERVLAGQPDVRLERWRASFSKDYEYAPGNAAAEKKRRIKADLAQTRKLLESLGAESLKDESYEELSRAFAALTAARDAAKDADEKEKRPAPDPRVLEDIRMNLERVKIVSETPESDYHGRIKLEVETDPFQVLFMGEYGFASCLSLCGSNVWSAVSNAIDVDKAVVWAREAGTNVVGRRLIALTPDGIVSYRTYANRHGLSLDPMFEDFLEAYARHCGTRVTHGKSPGPLLSDRWYDDGAM